MITIIKLEKLNLPITRYEISDELDNRFIKVKIWIAHTGVNHNGTHFTKETLLLMAKTLPYVPIVGFVGVNQYGEEDFRGHEERIILTHGDIKQEYLGVPCGFIPNEPNAKIEYRDGLEYLTCEGYIWTKFDKIVELFKRSNGRKAHSMEIDSLEGFVDEYGILNVTNSRFSGLCILGDDVMPAMQGSTVEFFSANTLKKEIENMIENYFSKEGSYLVNDLETTEKVEVEETVEELVEETVEEVETPQKEENESTTEPDEAESVEGVDQTQNFETEAQEESEESADANDHLEAEATDTTDDCGCSFSVKVAELEQELETARSELASKSEALLEYQRKEKLDIIKKYSAELGDLAKTFEDKLDDFEANDLEKELVYASYTKNKEKTTEGNIGVHVYSLNQENEAINHFGPEIGNLFK
ncbi:TPA: hypothetical protein ACGO1T_000525 [Streptococcus suis]